MNNQTRSLFSHLRRMGAAYLILVVSLIPTVIVYLRAKQNVRARDEARFNQAVQATQEELVKRIENYLSVLRGLRGLFDASLDVRVEEWDKYARSINLKQNYPGMMDIGFAQRVSSQEMASHVAAMRAAGEPNYTVRPPAERGEYFPLIHLNSGDEKARWTPGWDVFSETKRRATMEQARSEGQPIATGKVMLFSPDGSQREPGFIIYLPVYREGLKPSTPGERASAATGFVFGSFVARDLGQGIYGSQTNAPIDFEVFEGTMPSGENLMYASDDTLTDINAASDRYLSRAVSIDGLGRTWTMRFVTRPAFDLDSQKHLPKIALGGGLIFSLLLFGIAWTQVKARAAAEHLSGDLRHSEDSLRRANEELQVKIRERQQAEEALAAEKERLGVTLRSVGEGVITVDVQGHVALLNKAAEDLTGWTQEEAAGRPLAEVFHALNEQTRERSDNPAERVLRTDAPFNRGAPALLVSRKGQERIVVTSSAPIHDRAGQTVGVVLAFRDMTENRKLEAELNKAGKLESLGLLAGGIAHEFNNILTGIFGNISLAKMLAAADPPVQERLEKAELACQRAKEMTGQLLTFARGGAPIKRPKAIAQLLKECCDLAVLGSNVRCEFSFPSELWSVDVDPGQIGQAINNILLNAVQAMPDGGLIQVQAENVPAGGKAGLPLAGRNYVRISIHDQGTGISPEYLSRIFDPFFTTKHKGRGLGLATAYSIVKKHDGIIEVDSKPDNGAAFHFYLPTSTQRPALVTEDATTPPAGQGRVLVMDDEPEILGFAQAALKRLGYEVELARDGAEAIQRYRAAAEGGQPFSAVVMDLSIPGGMGGKEAIRRLLELDPRAKAIVSSGYSNDPVMSEYSQYGFRGMVAKPYTVGELARVLQEVTAVTDRDVANEPA